MTSFTFFTASSTPLPPNRFWSPSRSSTASRSPVEAPEGTAARPIAPPSSTTSTSIVGLPRLSRISRANTESIVVIYLLLTQQHLPQLKHDKQPTTDNSLAAEPNSLRRSGGGVQGGAAQHPLLKEAPDIPRRGARPRRR